MSTHARTTGHGRHPGEPETTRHGAWMPLVVMGLVIGAAFIGIYVGLQRAPAPHGLPLAAVGGELAATTKSALGGGADVTQVATYQEGEDRVRDGEAIAVLAAREDGIQLGYSGASGMSESGAARRMVAGIAQRSQQSVTETDLVPLAPYDSAGLSVFYVVFGVTLSSFVVAQGLTLSAGAVRLRHRLWATGGFALVIGPLAATLAGPVYGALSPPFVAMAATLVLLSAACALLTKSLGSWLGPPGIGLAVLLLTILGNATSGATIGYDLLPGWARVVSAHLPPGAAFRAIKGFGYYGGNGTVVPLVTLALWATGGLGLLLLHHRSGTRHQQVDGGSTPAHRLEAVAAS